MEILNKVTLKSIKLIIWDLDDTFWKGTINEGDIELIPENVDLIYALNDAGIVNSICSKNEDKVCKKILSKINIEDEFVFQSINWEPKGERIKTLISDMNLRPSNVLFIDDNYSNLMEAKYYSPDLMIAHPDIIPSIIKQLSIEKIIKDRTRFEQYKVLEKKVSASRKASSNEEFLRSCNIIVDIDNNCQDKIDRIYDILQRTNQLNFTKVRSSVEEIHELIDNKSIECGVVSVHDMYGDYGIVGFYAIKEKSLLHFAFSCRILGMGIEQYVYSILDFPVIVPVVGEISSELFKDVCPNYINISRNNISHSKYTTDKKILFKGPCDMMGIVSYFKEQSNIISEFTYASDKLGTVFGYNHSMNIVNSRKHKTGEFNFLTEEEQFHTSIFTTNYEYIFLSLLIDPVGGLYRNKSSNEYLAFGDYLYPLTDMKYWAGYCKGIYSPWIKFTPNMLENIAAEYEFLGLIPKKMFYQNICYIRENLPRETKLYFMTGNEIEFDGNSDGHLRNGYYNAILRDVVNKYENTYIFDVNEYVTSPSDLDGHQNHFTREATRKIAQKIQTIVSETKNTIVLSKPYELKLYQMKKKLLALFPKSLQPAFVKLYDHLRKKK